MDEPTVRRLNDLNRQFYQITAPDFDASRAEPWPGWERLLSHLRAPLSVLDVGCGNGRLGVFLAERLGSGVRYHGLDSAPALLDRARAALAGTDVRLDAWDLLDDPLPDGPYDVVALFGVLHHVPGADRRRALLADLAARVAPGGLLAFAAWRFYEFDRFRSRIVPWPDGITVEPGDHLLDWRRGTPALRYCHHVDEAEHAALVAATGLTELETYCADGRSHDLNRYTLLRRDPHD
ncbi:class I SAM-dependent methyltransferase [Aggregatilinea lenta]|uniref:class I SAM-dependent methyltransferase n=1 Tax=Aggregatilinea lenta TaxID=913108 RepID=UPI000E5B877E|nr:class I SAM-dependent methyltransferase [Aggregatilinea lenta]